MALVHSLLLRRRNDQNMGSGRQGSLRHIDRGRARRLDCDAVSDRMRDFEADFTDCGRAAIGAGSDPVGGRRRAVIGADPVGGNRFVIDRFSNVCPGRPPVLSVDHEMDGDIHRS